MFAITSFSHSLRNRKKKLINVVSIVLIQSVKDKNVLRHFFILITLYVNISMITIKTMLENKIIHNFVF